MLYHHAHHPRHHQSGSCEEFSTILYRLNITLRLLSLVLFLLYSYLMIISLRSARKTGCQRIGLQSTVHLSCWSQVFYLSLIFSSLVQSLHSLSFYWQDIVAPLFSITQLSIIGRCSQPVCDTSDPRPSSCENFWKHMRQSFQRRRLSQDIMRVVTLWRSWFIMSVQLRDWKRQCWKGAIKKVFSRLSSSFQRTDLSISSSTALTCGKSAIWSGFKKAKQSKRSWVLAREIIYINILQA